VVFPVKSRILLGLFLVTVSPALRAQVAISAIDHSAIDQSRLMQPVPSAAPAPEVDANGNSLGETGDAEDDSFGAQMILKDQQRVPAFYLSGGSSVYFTDNVALTRRDALEDVFAVVTAAGTWTRKVRPELEINAGLQASMFRYNRQSQLDFDDLGAGIGLSWTPQNWKGIAVFARYDFTELLDRHGNEILQDHEFSLGGQKVFPLGRAHAFSVGLLGSLGISSPDSAERNQLGIFGGYHLQLTRLLATDLLYRIAGQQYTDGDRLDLNQVASWNLRLKFTDWAEGNLYFSYGDNRSNRSVFDYRATSGGGGVGIFVRF
jgi:hypothetical protein